VIALCAIGLFATLACGSKSADPAVDQFINKDFAPTHAKILAARKAYGDVSASDIDEPGKLAFLKFRIAEVAAPFLAQALDESRKLTPPTAAKDFHAATISVLAEESLALGSMATALANGDAAAFKAGHQRMMDVTERVIRWEDHRDQLLKGAHVKLGPLPNVTIPEAPARQPAALH